MNEQSKDYSCEPLLIINTPHALRAEELKKRMTEPGYGIAFINPTEKIQQLSPPIPSKNKRTNCVNCGAPLNGYFKCRYCGTMNIIVEHAETILYADDEPYAFL